ncbi:hypothetical protein, partial [Streptacidiphilus anmyonensis]|uniref:hypothetical protein n=1 Tax=Streptacidiphilus anmyonensis TaxID=405782 RepID=UPI001F4480C7
MSSVKALRGGGRTGVGRRGVAAPRSPWRDAQRHRRRRRGTLHGDGPGRTRMPRHRPRRGQRPHEGREDGRHDGRADRCRGGRVG